MNPYHKRKGKEGGQFTTPTDLGGYGETKAQALKRMEHDARVARGKKNYHIIKKEQQDYSKENQQIVADWIRGAKNVPDNKPMDVTIHDEKGKLLGGIEVKTVLSNKDQKIDMKGAAQGRKRAWARKNGGVPIHLIILDDTKIYPNHNGKGRQLYYRRDVGAFRLHNMYRVRDIAELRQLVMMPAKKLPLDAR